uniref:Uncharacterized protein n=1 Tax=viral metagenome TaxID=1070528 RepID=A0A6C0B524_9ZZZZ
MISYPTHPNNDTIEELKLVTPKVVPILILQWSGIGNDLL